ncbi:MAG: hypothetical protein FJX29_11090 [Alphaproteobacteria bacterium]|nr:hypothetical protein [Alphaproteobacteria bacterium]
MSLSSLARTRVSTLAFSASFLAMSAVCGSAQTADIRIDNFEFVVPSGKQKLTFKNIEVAGTNLTREEIIAWFDNKGDKKRNAEIGQRAKLDRMVIPEITIDGTPGNEGQIIARNFVVIKYDQGKFESISLGSFGGKIFQKDAGADIEIKSGSIQLVDGDFSKMLAAVARGEDSDGGGGRLGRIAWNSFDVRFPEKSAAGIAMHQVTMGSFIAEGRYEGDMPTRGNATIKDVVFTPGAGSGAAQGLSMFGYDKVQVSMNMDGVYNAAQRSFRLTDFSFSGPVTGTLALTGLFGNIGPDAFRGSTGVARMGALLLGDVDSVALDYKDAGLFEKALVFYAKMNGKDPQAVRTEWAGMVAGVLPMLAGGDASIVKASAALAEFVRTPKNLNIALKGKNGPVKFGELQGIRDPQAALQRIDLTVTANR